MFRKPTIQEQLLQKLKRKPMLIAVEERKKPKKKGRKIKLVSLSKTSHFFSKRVF